MASKITKPHPEVIEGTYCSLETGDCSVGKSMSTTNSTISWKLDSELVPYYKACGERTHKLEASCSERNLCGLPPQSIAKRPKRSRTNATLPCSLKLEWTNKPTANGTYEGQESEKEERSLKTSLSVRHEPASSPKQICRSAAYVPLHPSLTSIIKEHIKEEIKFSEKSSTKTSQPQLKQSVSSLEDSALLPLPTVERRAANQPSMPQIQEGGHRSVTEMKEKKLSCKRSRTNKAKVLVRNSPSDTVLVSTPVKPETISGERELHQSDSQETTIIARAQLKGGAEASSLSYTTAQCTVESTNVSLKCPSTKKSEDTCVKSFSSDNSKKDKTNSDSDTLQYKAHESDSDQPKSSGMCPSVVEIPLISYNLNTDYEVPNLTRLPLEFADEKKRCTETNNEPAGPGINVISEETFVMQETDIKSNATLTDPQRSPVSDRIRRRREGLTNRHCGSSNLYKKGLSFQKNNTIAKNLDVNIMSRPHIQSMLVPDSPPHIHQERQRRHSRYRRKSPSPFSVERKGSRCNENLRSELGRQSSPPKKVRIVQDQKTSKSFQHTNIDMGEKRGSICPIKTTPHRSQESKTHMNLDISNVICRRILRKRSFPRDTLSCKDHRRVENLPSEDHSGFVMDKSPDVNRESRARSIGKNTKNESYQNHVLDSRSDMSIPSYKSSIAVSKALPADKERIFLTLNPSPRLIEKPCFVNDENFPTFFDEQKLNQPRFINSGVFRTDTSGNISDNSEYCQNHFPSTDEADFRDKSKSIKHWLNTSSFSKFNVQSNEKLAPDNHVSSKAETSIGTNYFISKSAARGSRHSSQLSAAGLRCDESLLLPALDEGSPQNTAALTAAGLRISSRRSPKGQGSKHHKCSTEGGYRWKTCITNLCALVVVLELIFVTFLWLKDMVSGGKTAFGDMKPNGNESQQNSATPAQ